MGAVEIETEAFTFGAHTQLLIQCLIPPNHELAYYKKYL